MTSLIVPLDGGGRGPGRPLVRTVDSLARQSVSGSIVLASAGAEREHPLLRSVVARLRAELRCGRNAAVAINSAVARTFSDWFALVPAGLTLDRTFVARCASAFAGRPELAAVVPSVRMHAADPQAGETWRVPSTTLGDVLADPRTTPPVIALRRSVWHGLDGFDEDLPGLADYEFWIRLCASNRPIMLLADTLASCDVSQTGVWPGVSADQDHLHAIRAVYQKHRASLEQEMEAVLVNREVGFVCLRDVHGELVRRRDADLAELDRIRAETAHHRAYVQHHGRGAVEWGDLRRTDPISRDWGYDRGTPIDRRYIEQFLAAHSSDVRGSVLEVQEDDFTRRFGGSRVVRSDVVDLDTANSRATVHADLRCAAGIAADSYDCIILTQTLHVIDDTAAVLKECARILKPGGVVLATLPAASRVCLEYGEEGDFWRMTRAGAVTMFEGAFGPGRVEGTAFGNVLTNVAFLHGLACTELTDAEFDTHDPYYPAVIGIRARKVSEGSVASGFSRTFGRTREARARGVILLYHRVDDTPDAYGMSVPVAVFDRQMAWLKKECNVLPLDDLLAMPPERLPDRAVALTFDDGYSDNLTAAAPALQRSGLPATFFVTTRWLEEPGEYWWDLLERALLDELSVPAEFAINVEGRLERLATRTREERRSAHRWLHERMVHAALSHRDELAGVIHAWASPGPPRHRPMTADQVRALARVPGITIGAHTVNHLALCDQPDEVSFDEHRKCRADLERLLNHGVDLVAYPYGAVSGGSMANVRMEWKWGLACDDGAVAESFDAARVPRIEVGGTTGLTEFAARLERFFV